jgi:hypothetical protein
VTTPLLDPLPLPPPDTGITPEDVVRARALWQRVASPRFASLLDAEPEPTDGGNE